MSGASATQGGSTPAVNLLSGLAAYIPRDRVALILGQIEAIPDEGVAVIADLSGFTALTEAMARELSPDRGAEEMTKALNGIFTPLVERVHAHRGSVMKFAGDAMLLWYGKGAGESAQENVLRALTSAWQMQEALIEHGTVATPVGKVTLRMKVGLTYGPVKRFALGLPEYGYEDVQVGKTLDEMSEAEHHAEPGDIILSRPAWQLVADQVTVREWRQDFAVLERMSGLVDDDPWPAPVWESYEREELVHTLDTYVPQQVSQTLLLGDVPVAELKPVISLFVQFHGLQYDVDEAVGEKLQEYFSTAQEVVGRYEGRVNRLITGDKGSLLHVIFGAPRVVEDQAGRAVRCALDLQATTGQLPYITMQRIGIATGRTYSGPVGSVSRHDYTTMGDSINLSARLMQNAADDQVLIDAGVRRQLGSNYEIADLGEITVKGKAEPLPVFAPLGVSRQIAVPAAGRDMTIIGRETVWADLEERILDLRAGQGGVVLLSGRVGVGKTYLLDALAAEHKGAGEFHWARGMGLAYGQPLSGYLIIDLLREFMDLNSQAGPAATAGRLQEFCVALFGASRRDATYPYLAQFMGLTLTGSDADRLQGLAGESIRWQTFELLREMMERLASERPVVLVLDDLQWVDPTSAEVVKMLLALTATNPLLVLVAMRPDPSSRGWDVYHEAVAALAQPTFDVPLVDLDSDSAQALLRHYAPALPEKAVGQLVRRIGGNPLFLVESVRMLALQGYLDEGTARELDWSRLELPTSVQGLLLAQIDRLALEARHTLQMAAVIGPQFLYKVLQLIGAGEQQVEIGIRDLSEREHILEDDPTSLGRAYLFRHTLVQESAYETLLYEHRRRYHLEVATALTELLPEQGGEQVSLLAFHYERAGQIEQAIHYHLIAADKARLLYANEEAEGGYKKALSLMDELAKAGEADDLERRARTYLKIAQVRSHAFDFVGAQDYYEQAFTLYDELGQAESTEDDGGEERIFRSAVLEHGPFSLDPGLSETVDVHDITTDLFEGLVELDGELNVMPSQAQRWTVSPDGMQYEFHLRPHLRWSDGTPLTAYDYVFAWQRNLSPATDSGVAPNLYPVQGAEAYHGGQTEDPTTIGVEALDDQRLRVRLHSPSSTFIYVVADPVSYPLPRHAFATYGANWSKPENLVCSGPFLIESWRQGEEIRLRQNPYYWRSLPDLVDVISLRFVSPTYEQYTAGVIDWCRFVDSALPDSEAGASVILQYLGTYVLVFSCAYPPFDQVAVRRAFALSIDQDALAREAWGNIQRPAIGGVVPPGLAGHSPEIGLFFDPDMAKVTLYNADTDSSGIFQALKLAVMPLAGPTAEFLADNWQTNISVDVDLVRNVPIIDILERIRSGEYHLAIIGLTADFPDPDNILHFFFHSSSPTNYWGWANVTFDQLVDEARATEDHTERLRLYHQADQLLVADATAIVPLYYARVQCLFRPGFYLENGTGVINASKFKLKEIRIAS